jgi:hypothetical protein
MAEKIKQENQIRFLTTIEDILPANVSLVNEMCDLLDLSMDSAYRRLRGETSLTFDEIYKLCQQYQVSFDSFSSVYPNNVTFNYQHMGKDLEGFHNYLKDLHGNIQAIRNAPNCEIVYAARDIPIFQNYCYPLMSAFKMFYYMKSIMNVTDFEKEQFNPDMIPKEFLDLGRGIYEAYLDVPSTEIWTDQSIYSTIKQIDFYWESGLFKSTKQALAVCKELQEEINDIQQHATYNSKFNVNHPPVEKNNYKFYNSDVEIANNTVFVKMGDVRMIFHSHHTFYLMSTSNQNYVEETKQWLDNIIRKSTLMSGVAEKQRYQFFRKVNNTLRKLIEKIEDE